MMGTSATSNEYTGLWRRREMLGMPFKMTGSNSLSTPRMYVKMSRWGPHILSDCREHGVISMV
jgi:hypothetical protein